VTVRQPVGADSNVAVEPPASGGAPAATALAADGTELGTVAGHLEAGHFVFGYQATLNGRAVTAYRVAAR